LALFKEIFEDEKNKNYPNTKFTQDEIYFEYIISEKHSAALPEN